LTKLALLAQLNRNSPLKPLIKLNRQADLLTGLMLLSLPIHLGGLILFINPPNQLRQQAIKPLPQDKPINPSRSVASTKI
jgi:hypothetical protein